MTEHAPLVTTIHTAPRQVTAICRFRGGPGREREAAEQWAFELTYYFTRGVGEPPLVTWQDGVYTCTGLIQTTHPGDSEVTDFSQDAWPLLDSQLRAGRERDLRAMYAERVFRFDGRGAKPGCQENRSTVREPV